MELRRKWTEKTKIDGISYRICLDKNLCPLKLHYIYTLISLLVARVRLHSTQDANIHPRLEKAMPRHAHGAIHCFFPRNFCTTCSSPRISAD